MVAGTRPSSCARSRSCAAPMTSAARLLRFLPSDPAMDLYSVARTGIPLFKTSRSQDFETRWYPGAVARRSVQQVCPVSPRSWSSSTMSLLTPARCLPPVTAARAPPWARPVASESSCCPSLVVIQKSTAFVMRSLSRAFMVETHKVGNSFQAATFARFRSWRRNAAASSEEASAGT